MGGDEDSGENYSVMRCEGERDADGIACYHQLLPGFVTHCKCLLMLQQEKNHKLIFSSAESLCKIYRECWE